MDPEVISDREVVRHVLAHPEQYVAYLGAGLSAEADVPTASQICDDIRSRLTLADPDTSEPEINRRLQWDDARRRYASCLSAFGNAAQRVRYFRTLLSGKTPVFGHHATALLMSRRVFSRTCLTTNFDKLLEVAFAQQGEVECQAIRNDDEAQYWEREYDKSYVIKLHGDYDTNNILNTRDETVAIGPAISALSSQALRHAGLVALGASGNEDSTIRFFNDLTSAKATSGTLSLGVHWGVYVGPSRPEKLDANGIRDAVLDRIASGAVSKDIVEMMLRASGSTRRCYFFPVWGGGSFLLSLIEATKDRSIHGTAEVLLDHEMRLRRVFQRAGLTSEAVTAHIKNLNLRRRSLRGNADRQPRRPETVLKCVDTRRSLDVRVLYGDITSRSLMGAAEFANVRRAVVSPEDTAVSAGGGVALGLLTKAGPRVMLNELAKLGPTVGHAEVAVTSGGSLPVHYVFHAAAIRIERDGQYSVAPEHVEESMRAALTCADALRVRMMLVPLIAAGLGPLTPAQSLEALLKPMADRVPPLTLQIVVYRESQLPRRDVEAIARRVLPASFDVSVPATESA